MSTFNFIIIKPRTHSHAQAQAQVHASPPPINKLFARNLALTFTPIHMTAGMYFVCKYTCAHGKINFRITKWYYAFGE